MGVAFIGTMCLYEQSVGVTQVLISVTYHNNKYNNHFTQDYSSSVFSVGATATHELGHIFDMEHDDG